ncbi:MAG TPA: YfhO family protein [Chitinophagaceae bacterium]
MKNGLFKKLLPHIIAIGCFIIVAVIYCKPVLEGKVVNQHDVIGWKGMAQQSFDYKEQHGHFPLWTNSMFSGMPAYTVAMENTSDINTGFIFNAIKLWLPKPVNYFFLACICFYFLCMVIKINPWIAIMASISYAYSSYDPVIIAVGHDTKMQAIALAPAVIASLLLIFQKRYLWGLALFAMFFGFQMGTQHLQIVYYTGIICAFIVIAFSIQSFRNKEIKNVLVSLGIALLAAGIGFCTATVGILPLQEYAKETMRGGKSELTPLPGSAQKTTGGLDKEYAFNWSYGIGETLTLIVPGIYGGSNIGGQEHTGTTKFTEKLSEVGVPEEQGLQMVNAYSYWGGQPSTSGPVYLGAIICFLFILGMIFLKGWHKWWIVGVTIFAIILAWGKNLASVNYFLFDVMPLYNKFRAPTIALFIPQLTFPLTGAMVLQYLIFTNKESKEAMWKKFKKALYITAGLVGILVILYFTFTYKGANDTQIHDNFLNSLLSQGGGQPTPQMQQQAQVLSQSLMTALQDDRRSLFGGDLLRSLIFIGLTAMLIAAFLKNKLKAMPLMICILLLSSIDLLAIGKRYLNDDSFVEPEQFSSTLLPNDADRQILADPAKPFRVFDQTDDPFNNTAGAARTSAFHNSIGGYSPAKLELYQDLIERQISQGNMQVFNMLNTKYFITQNPANGQPQAQINPNAFGPVWLVTHVQVVPNADAEMNALSAISLKDTAVVQQKFANQLKGISSFDTSASISVAKYLNDTITYKFTGNKDAFAVFSEIYYPLGWNAYIDGKKSGYVKTDYALRGMNIPAGNHTIDFIFEPASYKTGNTLTLISSIIIFILLIAAIIFEVRRNKRNTPAT